MNAITTNWKASRIYSNHRRELLIQALKGGGAFVDALETAYEHHFISAHSQSSLRARFHSTALQINSSNHQNHLDTLGLKRVNGTLLPLPSEPLWLSKKLYTIPLKILQLNILPKRAKLVREILDQSVFEDPLTPFRTFNSSNGSIIVGFNDETIRSFAHIAHELGHCIFERMHGFDSLTKVIKSEAFAQIFELEAVRRLLQAEGSTEAVEDWLQYQSKIDDLNFCCFSYEGLKIFQNFHNPNCILAAALFGRTGIIFRESFFVMPGYQMVYAQASLKRLTWLRAGGSMEDVLREEN